MNEQVKRIALALIALATAAAWLIHSAFGDSRSGGMHVDQAQMPVPAQLAIGVPVVVDLAADSETMDALDKRERREQRLDWLLFAAVAAMNKSPEEYSRIFYDLPASRQGYLRAFGAFEYGNTRSRYINGGTVIALVPAEQSTQQRSDALAQIADLHRKDLGGPFQRVLVVEYTLDEEAELAELLRREDVTYDALFSPAWGYVESAVGDLAAFQAFMDSVDDLTYARRSGEGMVLGGRRLAARKYGTIGVEEVASVWMAQQKIQADIADLEAYHSEGIEAITRKWDNVLRSSPGDPVPVVAQYRTEVDAFRANLRDEVVKRRLVGEPGFSLDPITDFAALAKAFDAEWSGWRRQARTIADPDDVSKALHAGNLAPFRSLLLAMVHGGDWETAKKLRELQLRHSYQAARYDGPLQGTEVGMVLFYTDLIAKLWIIDYDSASPEHGAIADFISHPKTPLSRAFVDESLQLNRGRLWFGPHDRGMQVANNGKSMLFARNATRIYAASLDEENPESKTALSAFLGASIDWWNDHYEEVAAFEPQYERLNQIMKWSAVIGWLSDTDDLERLAYVNTLPIERGHVFPTWAAKRSYLRFSDWDKLKFFPEGHLGTTTEALPLLVGPVTEGGVSLARRERARRSVLRGNMEEVLRRSQIDYTASTGRERLQTLEGAIYTFQADGPARFRVVARAMPGTKHRSTWVQLSTSSVERTVTQKPQHLALETRIGSVPLGDLQIARARNGLSVGWHAREVERAQSLARQLSEASAEQVILRNPLIETVVWLEGQVDLAVKLRGSQRWIRFSPESGPRVDIDPAWLMRGAGEHRLTERVIQANVLSEAEFVASLPPGRLVMESSSADQTRMRWLTNPIGRPNRVAYLDSTVGRIEAWIDDLGHLVLAAPPGSNARLLSAARELREPDLDALRIAATSDLNASVAPRRVFSSLEQGDYRSAARQISADPVTAKATLDRAFAEDLAAYEAMRAERSPVEALRFLDRLIEVYGRRPDLLMRRGLAQIERGRMADASADAMAATGPLRHRDAFFDEVNARLKKATRGQEELYRFAQYVDLREQSAGTAEASIGRPRVREGTERFEFDFEIRSLPHERLTVNDVNGLVAPLVYRQHTVTLDSLDWSSPVHHALVDVIQQQAGQVIRLRFAPLVNYRPGQIAIADQGITLHATSPSMLMEARKLASYPACADAARECDTAAPFEHDAREIVLVLEH